MKDEEEERIAKRVGWILAALFTSTMTFYAIAVTDDTANQQQVATSQQSPS